jgi:hypothetical protein
LERKHSAVFLTQSGFERTSKNLILASRRPGVLDFAKINPKQWFGGLVRFCLKSRKKRCGRRAFPKMSMAPVMQQSHVTQGQRKMFTPAKKRKVIKMKIVKVVAAMAALISLGVFETRADTTTVVQNIGIFLTGVQPGGPIVTRPIVTTGVALAVVDTRRVVEALGTATGNTFSRWARLVAVTPLGGGASAIQVRDGTRTVDVSSFFYHQQVSDFVSGSVSNTFTKKTTGLDYSIQRIALVDGSAAISLHFDVNGFTSETSVNGLPGVSNMQMDVSGSGDANGNLLILHGSIMVEGSKLEVVPGGDDGGDGGGISA